MEIEESLLVVGLCPISAIIQEPNENPHCLFQCMKVKSENEVAQSGPTLSDPMDCSPPGSSVHGISRQEYWSRVPFPSPGNFPNPESPALAGRFFTTAHLGSHLLKKQGNLHLNTANILSNTLCFTHKVKNTRVHRK